MPDSWDKESLMKELGGFGCLASDGKPSPSALKRPVVALVPAAGKGSRLDFDGPKALFPLGDKPALNWIYDALGNLVEKFCLVVSPAHKELIGEYIRADGLAIELGVQEEPTGMADAILCAEPLVAADAPRCDYLIVWGDQVTVARQTVLMCLLHHQCSPSGPVFTFPTCRVKRPYIHFRRDSRGAIDGLLQQREGDLMPEEGETDCGVFIIRGSHLFDGLKSFKKESGAGRKTGEFNFLPYILDLARKGYGVDALPIADVKETRGINSLADVDHILEWNDK